MKVLEGMHWGAAQLNEKGIENARFDADILLAEVLNITRDRLYIECDRELTIIEEEAFSKKVIRRSDYEPLQYILGRQEFMGLSFCVDDRVLIPRADSEILVERWLDLVREEEKQGANSPIKVADLCTGSGALAISMAYYCSKAEVVGTDLSEDALNNARQNAGRLGVSVQWRQGDFVEALQGERWDYIISNPPYVTEEEYRQCAQEIFREPSMAFLGGQDGLDFYRRLAEDLQQLLNPRGKLLVEIGWDQAKDVCGIFQEKEFETQVFTDLSGHDRVILVRRT